MSEKERQRFRSVAGVPWIKRAILKDIGAMAAAQHILLALKARSVDAGGVAAARCRFMVDQSRERSPNHAKSFGHSTKAKINVVIRDLKFVFVERSDNIKAGA